MKDKKRRYEEGEREKRRNQSQSLLMMISHQLKVWFLESIA